MEFLENIRIKSLSIDIRHEKKPGYKKSYTTQL
jgi:hypothetical protein